MKMNMLGRRDGARFWVCSRAGDSLSATSTGDRDYRHYTLWLEWKPYALSSFESPWIHNRKQVSDSLHPTDLTEAPANQPLRSWIAGTGDLSVGLFHNSINQSIKRQHRKLEPHISESIHAKL
jgi:hypothetical protein